MGQTVPERTSETPMHLKVFLVVMVVMAVAFVVTMGWVALRV